MNSRKLLKSVSYKVINGGDFKLESANVPLGEVRDLAALVDRVLAVFTVPRGLITGDVVNFATLKELSKKDQEK